MKLSHTMSASIAIAIAVAIGAAPASARRMEKVLQECEKQQPFPQYADCIRERYSKVGNTKSSGSVFAFYALLAEIRDQYESSKGGPSPMAETQARSNVYRAWQSTIEASNVGETGKICSMNGNVLACS